MRNKYAQLSSFYEENFNKIYNYFFFRLRMNIEQAEDLTQSAFLRAAEKLDLYDEKHAFAAWFWKLAKNLLIDHLRKQKNVEPLENGEEVADSLNLPEQTEKKLKMEHVYEHLEKLPEAKKELVLLYYISDVPVETIASMYHTTTNNIRDQLSRIIKHLSHNLQFYER